MKTVTKKLDSLEFFALTLNAGFDLSGQPRGLARVT